MMIATEEIVCSILVIVIIIILSCCFLPLLGFFYYYYFLLLVALNQFAVPVLIVCIISTTRCVYYHHTWLMCILNSHYTWSIIRIIKSCIRRCVFSWLLHLGHNCVYCCNTQLLCIFSLISHPAIYILLIEHLLCVSHKNLSR